MSLLLPVGQRRMSSWYAHTQRGTPSSEPGTDFYCPIGTPVVAPADGAIWGSGLSIGPATGRWVGVNFDNGMSFRALHMSRLVRTSGRVSAGQVIAYSGASGYGEEDWSWNVAETGGAHTHVTLWPTWDHRYGYDGNGRPFTIDFMDYVDGAPAGGGSTPFEEEDMFSDSDRNLLLDVQNKLSISGAGYGRPEVIQQRVDQIVAKLETGAGYDWLPALANQGNTILAVLGKLETGGLDAVDVDALAAAIREGLGDEVADELAQRLAG